METLIINSIENKKTVEFSYEGENRTVEIHCYGITTKGNHAIRAFQTGGFSSSGTMGWKMYDLSKAANFSALDMTFTTRDGYKKGDKGMSKIFCEVK